MLIELFTAQQQDLAGLAFRREISRLETEMQKWTKNSAEHRQLEDAISAIEGMYAQLHGLSPEHVVEVGLASAMPGTAGGFTMASFNGKQVPAGSKVFAKVPR